MTNRLLSYILFFFSLLSNSICAQINNNLDESLQHLILYINSKEFKNIGLNNNALQSVDSMYIKAVKFNKGNLSESLLALTFAALPFDRMPVKIPLINSIADLKLQEVDSLIFAEKNSNLPSDLFFDTRVNGDRDKLAHFFGNAFLSYNVSIFNISKILGIFVELFEESFKVGGGLDIRDLKINYLGEFFGQVLKRDEALLPSEVLSLYILLHLKFYN